MALRVSKREARSLILSRNVAEKAMLEWFHISIIPTEDKLECSVSTTILHRDQGILGDKQINAYVIDHLILHF